MMDAIITLWAVWVAFGLPISLGRKMRAALAEPDRSRSWRAGKLMFYGGILVWCPYAGARRLLGWYVPFYPVLAAHAVLLYGGLLIQRMAGKQQAPPATGAGGAWRDSKSSSGPP